MPILHIRDKNGNFIPIPAISGKDGKSAYEQAKEGGFQGTEEEFIALLNGLTSMQVNPISTEEPAHYSDFNNPHKVTKEQIGAFSIYGGTIWGDTNVYGEHYPTVKVGRDDANTLSIFYTPNKTVDLYNWTNGEPTTLSLGNVNSMLLRDVCKLWVGAKDYQIYGDHNASELGIARCAAGSYKGTNTYGVSKPNTLTFDFVPKLVIVSKRGETNAIGGGTFIWISPDTILNFLNNGSTYWCHPTLEGTTLSWYNAEGASYQLNSSSYDYDYFAWG